MKAAVRTSYGPPDVVRIAEVAKPAPKGNEVLVRVHATTVNRTDCGLRAAKPFLYRFFLGLRRPRLTVLGNEFAGEVEAVGGGVTSFRVGDRVFGFSGDRFGAHAEYLAIPEDGVLATMPANLTYEEAAPSTEGSQYALTGIRAAKVRSGQDVLVNGATGAIGSAAVQLLKGLGAKVTAVCRGEHAELVRGLGADRVIDYTAADFTRDAQAYDVVIDAVAKSSFGRCRRLLKPGGTYLPTDLGPPLPEPGPGAGHPAVPRQEGPLPPSQARPGMATYFSLFQGADRVRGVPSAHRPTVPAGPDRRGVPLRRDGPEGRQRGDQRRAVELVRRARRVTRRAGNPGRSGGDYLAMDDAELVRLAREGDKEAFAALLARHRGMLLALCRRALGDDGLAEDAAQEAALQAMLSLDRLQRPERFGAWLGGIGLNVCRRWQRRQAREGWSLAALTGGRAVPDEAPAEAAEAAEEARRVRRAVGRLPAGQRAAVVLFYLAGLAHREVAAALGIGVGAVKTRLHKARAALREELAAWWKEDEVTAGTAAGPVAMRVTEVRRQPAGGDRPEKTVIVLDEPGGRRRLAIWVGSFEALSVAFALEGTELPRPMAYQFMSSLLEAAGGRLAEARVTRLDEGTFYAVAVVDGPGGRRELDARPSDALNLALVTGAPILVDPRVLEEASGSERGAELLGEVAAYPDDTAAIVAEAQAHAEAVQAEYERRR